MPRVYCSPIFAEHRSEGHPERHERAECLLDYFYKHFTDFVVQSWCKPNLDWVSAVHTSKCIEQVQHLSVLGGGHVDADTYVEARSFSTALEAVAAGVDATKWCVENNERAFVMCRPPGHHATAHTSMGFCLFNNIAIAAQYALDHLGLKKILIVDWDVHHGNGTQDIFYESDQVFFMSCHKYPFYPGSGAAVETGSVKGKGFTLNIPIESHQEGSKAVRRLFQEGLEQVLGRFHPELIMISAGFDAHVSDPLGNLSLSAEDFRFFTAQIAAAADRLCSGRVVSFLEGGYDLHGLVESAAEHFSELIGQ